MVVNTRVYVSIIKHYLESAQHRSEYVDLYSLLPSCLCLFDAVFEVLQHLLLVFIADAGKEFTV